MKQIKIKICGYDPENTISYGKFILGALEKNFNVELSEKPDYIFFNETSREYLDYPAIRIFFTGENIHPNYNLCDYALSFDIVDFGDRHYRLPIYAAASFYRKNDFERMGNPTFETQKVFTKNDLEQKTGFCSFVYSNYLADDKREKLFSLFSSYKRVNSGGEYLNNTGETLKSKLDFERKHKFSLAIENSSRDGYTTEKLITSLAADTIPIYWGNPKIDKEFNTGRFINCHEYESMEAVLERVKQIDRDDNLYLEIINTPVLANGFSITKMHLGFEDFLKHICEQPKDRARRLHINPVHLHEMEDHERNTFKLRSRARVRKQLLSLFYRPMKNIPGMEKLKIWYYRKMTQ